MSKLDELYKKVFELEEQDEIDEANKIRDKIRKVLRGEDIEDEEVVLTEENMINSKKEFFYKTRKKAFHKNLREQLSEVGSIDDIELALSMTSMLTHCLIEMQKEGKEKYHLLELKTLTETVSNFLSGELSTGEVVNVLEGTYKEYLFSRLEE